MIHLPFGEYDRERTRTQRGEVVSSAGLLDMDDGRRVCFHINRGLATLARRPWAVSQGRDIRCSRSQNYSSRGSGRLEKSRSVKIEKGNFQFIDIPQETKYSNEVNKDI